MSKKPKKPEEELKPIFQTIKIPLTIDCEGMERALGKEKWLEMERKALWDMVCRIEREREEAKNRD